MRQARWEWDSGHGMWCLRLPGGQLVGSVRAQRAGAVGSLHLGPLGLDGGDLPASQTAVEAQVAVEARLAGVVEVVR